MNEIQNVQAWQGNPIEIWTQIENSSTSVATNARESNEPKIPNKIDSWLEGHVVPVFQSTRSCGYLDGLNNMAMILISQVDGDGNFPGHSQDRRHTRQRPVRLPDWPEVRSSDIADRSADVRQRIHHHPPSEHYVCTYQMICSVSANSCVQFTILKSLCFAF